MDQNKPYSNDYPSITVGKLRQELLAYADDWTIDFSGLDFYRVKPRDQTHLQIEFDQLVYRSNEGLVVVENLG